MKTRILCLLATALSALATAQAKPKDPVKAVYEVDFDMNFDNREFYKSAFSESMTIFGARLTPTVGLTIQQEEGTRHSVMAGIDVMKDFGSPMATPKELLKEPTLYYRLDKDCGKLDLELYAGIWIDEDIVNHPSDFITAGEMVDISGVAEGKEICQAAFSAGVDHETFSLGLTYLSHPVASYLKVGLREAELHEETFEVVVIELQRI